jgi:hypothetical protein
MPTDRYTKFILTIIAIGLTAIALRPLFSPSPAGAQMSGCGLDPQSPCYIAGWGPQGTVPIANIGRFPLKVVVKNPASHPVRVIVVNSSMPMYHP